MRTWHCNGMRIGPNASTIHRATARIRYRFRMNAPSPTPAAPLSRRAFRYLYRVPLLLWHLISTCR